MIFHFLHRNCYQIDEKNIAQMYQVELAVKSDYSIDFSAINSHMKLSCWKHEVNDIQDCATLVLTFNVKAMTNSIRVEVANCCSMSNLQLYVGSSFME